MYALANILEVNAEDIVRKVDFPAMQDGPLYRLMFSADLTQAQQAEVIQWYVEGLRDALRCETNTFLQICGPDGTPLGFCGWTMEHRAQSKTMNQRASEARQEKDFIPEPLDLSTWLSVSRDLKNERERVMEGLSNVCRLTFMSVHPNHQRKGLGSLLLKQACVWIDQMGYPAFAMASPAGVRLYEKFGFCVVGTVDTREGAFTSMIRQSRCKFS